MTDLLKIAVVGHTNVGKTSLMRTLTRRRDFGEVSSRPATTRSVDMAEIRTGSDAAVQLYDTPGLEDSTGLLRHLEALKAEQALDWTETIDRFAATESLQGDFTQEAKALAQVRAADVALYVIDTRERVRAKHRDELEILGRCAIPVVPVFNFVADAEADDSRWREQLARVNMHAVASFDTVVFDEAGELALYRKVATLSDRFAPVLEQLIAELAARRQELKRQSARLIADMLVSAAARAERFTAGDADSRDQALNQLKDKVRGDETGCVKDLLALHQFGPKDYLPADLPIIGGEWQEDPFDPATLEHFGISAGRAAATGAAAGVAIDLMVGGMTLGAAALTGATLGFLADQGRKHGRSLIDRLEGRSVLRADDATLQLLATRQTLLLKALLQRGHGAQEPIKPPADPERAPDLTEALKALRPARRDISWAGRKSASPRRQEVVDAVAQTLLRI